MDFFHLMKSRENSLGNINNETNVALTAKAVLPVSFVVAGNSSQHLTADFQKYDLGIAEKDDIIICKGI
ncbi:MAG: hypothetical protein SCH71_12260 [Desulfobulbaceae bacterium]|nr:hypothetical protein [Desulfobulbaceae bacterium]